MPEAYPKEFRGDVVRVAGQPGDGVTCAILDAHIEDPQFGYRLLAGARWVVPQGQGRHREEESAALGR